MKVRTVFACTLAILLAGIIAFGPAAHAFLPHEHSANESIASLLHSALQHEQKKLLDAVPLAPFVLFVIAFLVAPLLSRRYVQKVLDSRSHTLTSLRRGILPYRRFG